MKTWVIILLVLIFIFIIVPLIYFAIIAKTVRTGIKEINNQDCDYSFKLTKPPVGKEWFCNNGNWELRTIIIN